MLNLYLVKHGYNCGLNIPSPRTKFVKNQRFGRVTVNLRTRAPDNGLVSQETLLKRALLRAQRVKRSKFAMLLAYAGHDYYGFQRNPGVKTIEDRLLTAMLEAGYITEHIFNDTKLIKLIRASRTDKGVSAIGQVVSLKLPRDAHYAPINNRLPQDIRVIALVKATRGFNSRKHSSARVYSYILPSFSFARDSNESFRLSSTLRQLIDSILSLFIGSHRFHNFTTGKYVTRYPLDSTAFRTIISFRCEEQLIHNGMEFLALKIKGVSFMQHQIRKMIGLTIAVVRGLASHNTVINSLQPQFVNIPVAPGLGLILEEVEFERYNRRFGRDGIHAKLDWSQWNNDRNLFKKRSILPRIFFEEKTHKSMFQWINVLECHNFSSTRGNPSNMIYHEDINVDE